MSSISISIKDCKDKEEFLHRVDEAQLTLFDIYQKMLNPSEEINNNRILKDGYFWVESE